MPSPLDETGHFTSDYGDLSGLYAHDVAPLVFEYLKRQNLLFKTELVTHRYPHCWRCHTKCLFRLEDSWYIDTNQIRPLMKKAAATVNWHPKFVGRRMQNWLDSMEDWMISRKRFYGLSLPFYECDCGQLTVVGSLEELEKLAIDPKPIKNLISLHRPWIDEIKIKCSKCGQSVNRVPDVGDCWLDAGIIPFSTLKYLSDKNYWRKWFPAELVTEMTEQVRLWFYSLLFFSVTFENTTSYQNVVTYAEVRDEHGERMSKTKKMAFLLMTLLPRCQPMPCAGSIVSKNPAQMSILDIELLTVSNVNLSLFYGTPIVFSLNTPIWKIGILIQTSLRA